MLQCFLLSPLGWLHLFIQWFAQGSSAELQAPIYRKPPPKPAANALSIHSPWKMFMLWQLLHKRHWIDHLSSELLPFALPHLFFQGSSVYLLIHTGLTLNGNHLPVARLGCFTMLLLTEHFLPSPLPTRSNGNEKMAVIVTHMADGKWMLI